MPFSFNTALSGLNANSNALGVIGNNIANANTIGFRSGSITFADIFAGSQGARYNGAGTTIQVGDGVQTAAIHTNYSQGSLNESGSSLHAAIAGNGFFVTRNADGTSNYTRAGDFTINNDGYLVATNGSQVQGYAALDGTVQPGTALSSLRIPIGQTLAPQTTTNGTFRLNLDSGGTTGGASPAIFHAPMQIYDSRGASRNMDLTYTRLADGSYNLTATVDGNPAQLSANGGAPSATPVNFTFDSNGQLTAPTSLSVVPDQTQLNGATLPTVAINLRETNSDGTPGSSNITNYARPSAVSSTAQDGYAAGEINGASADPRGVISAVFSNGQTRPIGEYALATFNAQEGLSRAGGNMFAETLASGQPTIGEPGTGGRGGIAGGFLEQSNVNLTNEFVSLIEAQRGFQANSKVITTLNQTFQDLLQII